MVAEALPDDNNENNGFCFDHNFRERQNMAGAQICPEFLELYVVIIRG